MAITDFHKHHNFRGRGSLIPDGPGDAIGMTSVINDLRQVGDGRWQGLQLIRCVLCGHPPRRTRFLASRVFYTLIKLIYRDNKRNYR